MAVVVGRSFASGELSPALHARVDLAKYQNGLRTCRNWMVKKDGSASTRPGTVHICETSRVPTLTNTRPVRLIRFEFNADAGNTYQLLFGHQYMRVIKADALLYEAQVSITSISNAAQAVVTRVGHGLVTGDEIQIIGVTGMTQLSGRNFKVEKIDADTFRLLYMDNATYVNSTGFGAYVVGDDFFKRVYQITTPYDEADLAGIRFAQTRDIVDLTHVSYPPQQLIRLGDTSWTIGAKLFAPSIARPVGVDASTSDDGSKVYRYRVTAVDPVTFEESLPAYEGALAISGATNATPIVITTATAHNYVPGDEVYIQGVQGNTAANGIGRPGLPDGIWGISAVTGGAGASKLIANAPGGVDSVAGWPFPGDQTIVITTVAAHGYSNGDRVKIAGVTGATAANGTWYISNVAANSFRLVGSELNAPQTAGGDGVADAKKITTFTFTLADSVGNGAFVAAGTPTVQRTHSTVRSDILAPPPNGVTVRVRIPDQAGISQWNVYRAEAGVYGYIGTTSAPNGVDAVYRDYGYTPDFTAQPPTDAAVFLTADNYPKAVTYYQQRAIYANTNNEPETLWASVPGQLAAFTVHSPVNPADAIKAALPGRVASAIQHLLGLRRLLVFMSGMELVLKGDSDGTLLPGVINPEPQSYNGIGELAPIPVNQHALYVQARGSIVRDLVPDDTLGYKSEDLTAFAAHLLQGHEIVDWAYQQSPDSTVWAVRDDGVLLGLTYIREQEIVAWHRHDFQGDVVENVSVIPRGNEDAVYLVIRRTIPGLASLGGSTRKYVERLNTRQVTEETIKDFIGMDSTLSYDGRNTFGDQTFAIEGGTNWTYDEHLTLDAIGAGVWTADDIGNGVDFFDADGNLILRFVVDEVSPYIKGHSDRTVPVALRNIAWRYWAKTVDKIGGLWHLEGESLSVLGDGYVEANPLRPEDQYPKRTVTNGEVQLGELYGVIHAGLPVIADLETLDVDTTQGGTLMDKAKIVTEVSVYEHLTRGVFAGNKPPDDDDVDPIQNLNEIAADSDDDGNDAPTPLYSGARKVPVAGEWSLGGRICLRQIDPVPATILAWAPSGFRSGRP